MRKVHPYKDDAGLVVLAILCFPITIPGLILACVDAELGRMRRKREQKRDRQPPKVTSDAVPFGFVGKEDNKERKEANEQEDSLWFRLPAELREIVYEEVFGVGLVVLFQEGTLKSWKVKKPSWTVEETKLELDGRANVLPLLLSCRKIYTEALSKIYTSPKFTFVNPISFLAFSASIFPYHFQALRSLNLDFSLRLHDISSDKLYFVNIVQVHPSKYPPPKWSPKPGFMMGYRAFHATQCKIKNWYLNLPEVPKGHKHIMTCWSVCCGILNRLKGLSDLRIVLCVDTGENTADRFPKRTLETLNNISTACMRDFSIQYLDAPRDRRRLRTMWKKVVNDGDDGIGWVKVLEEHEGVG